MAKEKKKETRDGGAAAGPSSGAPPPDALPVEGAVYLDRGPGLPGSYGEDRITALVRDPFVLFFHWELDGERSRARRAALGEERFAERRWVIRVANRTRGDRWDVAVHPGAGNWYLHVEPECEYDAEIGVIGEDGAFDRYALSNRVRTPRRGFFTGPGEKEAGGAAVVADAGFGPAGGGAAPSSAEIPSSSDHLRGRDARG